MSRLNFAHIQVGDALPELTLAPINRTTLALFAGASGDHNAVHIDLDFARRAGMPDVFAHGMLSMAYLGRLLTLWVDQRQLRQFSGRVVEKFEADGEPRVRLEIRTINQYGEPRVLGDAVIAL
jgi:acyl dehydratase